MQAALTREVDGSPHESRADAAATPPRVDEHPELAVSEAADLDVDHPDDAPAGLGDDRLVDRPCEGRRALLDVDRRLGADLVPLLRNRGHQLRHRAHILGPCRPDCERRRHGSVHDANVVARRDLPHALRRHRAGARGCRELAHVVLEPSRGVDVEEAHPCA